MHNLAQAIRWIVPRAWHTLITSLGTTTLSVVIFSVLVPLGIPFLSSLIVALREKRSLGGAFKTAATTPAQRLTQKFTAGIWIALFAASFVVTSYEDHTRMVAENERLNTQVKALQGTIFEKTHNLTTGDPVFSNVAYMLQAFGSFRGQTRTPTGQPDCSVRISAPEESRDFAMTFSMLSVAASGCPTFGPELKETEPDRYQEGINGMVEGKIVVHMRPDDIAANNLFNELGNHIPLQRSYKLGGGVESMAGKIDIYQQTPHYIWLQFGPKMNWNSAIAAKAVSTP